MNKLKYKLSFIISFIFIISIGLFSFSASAVPLSDMNVGIHSYSDGSFENIRQLERFNKMQAYIYPTNDYNDGSSIDPFETFTSYLPVNIPQFIVFRDNVGGSPSTSKFDNLVNLYSYSGDNEVANSSTVFTPISFSSTSDNIYHYSFSLNFSGNNSVASQKEYWHGDIYSVYNGNRLYGFSVTNPSGSNGSNIIYIKGTLDTVYSVIDEDGILQYYLSTKILDTYYILDSGSTFVIDHNLDSAVISTDYNFATSHFSGDVMVRYGNTQNTRVLYGECLSHDFASVLSYNDSNLEGFASGEDDFGESGVSISNYYMQYWSRTLSPTVGPGLGNLLIESNGTYNVSQYTTATVNVPQEVEFSGLFDWIATSTGGILQFEIAPGWSIGVLLTIIIGLAVAVWVLKVFLGG